LQDLNDTSADTPASAPPVANATAAPDYIAIAEPSAMPVASPDSAAMLRAELVIESAIHQVRQRGKGWSLGSAIVRASKQAISEGL
jgi:hypothetical protein